MRTARESDKCETKVVVFNLAAFGDGPFLVASSVVTLIESCIKDGKKEEKTRYISKDISEMDEYVFFSYFIFVEKLEWSKNTSNLCLKNTPKEMLRFCC